MTLEHEDHGINGINATLQYLTLREIAAALLVYFVVYVLWVYIAPVVHTDFPSAGQFGDMYGVLNAFVSGLAMAGVILALFLQRDQNVMQARELKAALREAKEQTDALKTQVKMTHRQMRRDAQLFVQRNRPAVFIDRWEAYGRENDHYIMRNVGGGFATNVYLIDRDDPEKMTYPLGSLGSDAQRRLPEYVNSRLVDGTTRMMGGTYLVIAEGPPSRTTQWTPTLNFLMPSIDIRGGQVRHELASTLID